MIRLVMYRVRPGPDLNSERGPDLAPDPARRSAVLGAPCRALATATLVAVNAARFAALIWALLLLAFWGTVVLTDLTAAGLLTEFVRAAVDGPWGWALLIAAYALRTVLLLPITILTVFAGYALGPWIGATFAVVAAVASSAASYGLARFVASGGRPPAVRAGTADDDGRV
ncbi:MAG: hypothetical protein WD336_07785, partial [Trueperaceae bacterium]